VVIGERFTIHSQVLDEERSIWVHLPQGYDETDALYPVMVLLDGPSHFHHATGVTQFLARADRMPKTIVVGVANTNRTRDLTPPVERDVEDAPPGAGGADGFLSFLVTELRPWLDERYRTAPYRVLVGHSLGGLFATHVLSVDPTAYDAYVSISPSLWWDDESWEPRVRAGFAENPDLEASLYMTMGDEGGDMLAGAWSLTRILEMDAPESLRWKWVEMPAETHASIPHRTLYDGLEWVFDGWSIPSPILALLEEGEEGFLRWRDHWGELSREYGWEIRPEEARLNQLAYGMMDVDLDQAMRLFEYNAALYPESANVYDSLGDGLVAVCRLEDARDAYQQAVDHSQGGPNAQVYQDNLETTTARLDSDEPCTPREVAP
jgi:predicted alpha/beta superfamily hydrolase